MLPVLVIVAASAVAWLCGLLRLDPHRGAKGTSRRVARFFLLGMLSVVPAMALSWLVPAPSPSDDPSVGNLLLFVCVYAPIEEFSKFIVFLLLVTKSQSLREPPDGIFQAAAVGLGFAIIENLEYGVMDGAGVALVRSFITPLRHMVYAAIWGFAYATRKFGRKRMAARDLAVIMLALAPSALVHGLSNFLANVGFVVQVTFGFAMTATMLLILRRLERDSPFSVRDIGRPRESLHLVQSALVHDPANPHLHLRAAHFQLRAGDPGRAVAHLDRYLSARPGDLYGLGMKGAACVLTGSRGEGEQLLERAEALMPPRTRRLFRRNLRRIIAPGRGRAPGGFGESMLRTWLFVSDQNRERIDPRRVPPVRARVD